MDKVNTPIGEWKQVAEDPFSRINQEDHSYYKRVKLCYDHLPYDMKDCFLYLATFPIGHSIVASKLMHLWIAEGLIPPMEGGCAWDLELKEGEFLKVLVDKNLLIVLNRKADGQIKTCRIHNALYKFCRYEDRKKNLFHDIHGNKLEAGGPSYRRLCVHYSFNMNLIASNKKPSTKHIHSFLSSFSKEIVVESEHLVAIPKAFPTIRVLDIEHLKFSLLPKEFYRLYYLKYLAISTDLKVLPKEFNNLWNMQTLVFNTSYSTLDVKANIWSMTKLRHVLINASAQLPPPSTSKKENSLLLDLQTLSGVSPPSFAEVESLKVMELFHTNSSATTSAREIQKQKLDKENALALSIYP